ncbi:MAG TPA: nucleotidyltransferase family protein [Stellaceae bacterium]|nr:nucleotidyltransferase family protein [Stellaceae bacterium]
MAAIDSTLPRTLGCDHTGRAAPIAMLPALVLAAGLGTRIRAISGGLPKPMVPFRGTPILVHNLRWLASGGVRKVWINLHFAPDAIRDAIGDGSDFGLSVEYLYEPILLGTAGAFGTLGAHLPGPALVVYGDNLLKLDLTALLATHRAARADATVALFDRARHAHTGIAGSRVQCAEDGRVTAFVEGSASASAAGPELVNTGVYVVEARVRDLIPAGRLVDFGREVFPTMLERGDRVQGHVIEEAGFCLGLDTPESHVAGNALLDANRIRLAS